MYLMLVNYTLKMAKTADFMFSTPYHKKKKTLVINKKDALDIGFQKIKNLLALKIDRFPTKGFYSCINLVPVATRLSSFVQ